MRNTGRQAFLITVICGMAILTFPQTIQAQVQFGGDATGLITYDFEDLAMYSASLGTAFSTIRNDELGITFGEKLVGQAVQADGVFDVITGTPQTPLRMDTSVEPKWGVNIINIFSSTMIDGIGPLGFPDRNALAEGAITVLYDIDQQVIAFDLIGSNDGIVFMQLFNRQGMRIADYTIEYLKDDTFIFTSSQRDIAAITLTNTDKAGLVYDNFRFVPAPSNRDTFCNTNGPYVESRQGDVTSVQLDGRSADDPNGDLFSYHWVTDCSGATYDDKHSATPNIIINTPDTCQMECTVTLLVDNGVETDVCTTTVTINGMSASGLLSCPENQTVESNGEGNLDELNEWLNNVSTDDPYMTNNYDGFAYECGNTGSVTVTWTNNSSSCGDTGECTSTFTIVDTTPPTIDLDTTPIIVEDSDCSGSENVELPEATATDSNGQEVIVTNDAPDTFTFGTTNVTYSATDDCGNTSTAILTVTVLSNAGIDIEVVEHFVASRSRKGSWWAPMAGVTVAVYDSSQDGCARELNHGISSHSYADIVAHCEAVSSAMTDENGTANIHLPSGRFVVIVMIDDDGDGMYDDYLGSSVGEVPCGNRKSLTLQKVTQAGDP